MTNNLGSQVSLGGHGTSVNDTVDRGGYIYQGIRPRGKATPDYHSCTDMSKATLFQPTRIGDIRLQHRIVFAPMTRLRASSSCAPVEMMTEYYRQRASTQGTLLITEATAISAAAGGIPNIPHIETKEQLDAWKKVCDMPFLKKNLIDVEHHLGHRRRS